MINPYYFFFYLLYIKLHQYAKEPERIPFSLATFMFLILAVHIVFLGKQIYWCFNYCSKIQLYADNQYHIKNNLHSIAILTAFSTCKSIKKY